MADDVNHPRQRRALSRAFSTKALLEQEYIVYTSVETFSEKMKEFADCGQTVNITDWFAYTIFDVIGDMALGEPFECLTNEDFRFWVPLISDTIKAGAIEQATRRMAPVGSRSQEFLKWCIPKSTRATRRSHLDYSRGKILKRMQETKKEHKDFLYYLMRQQENIKLEEVIINGALFITSGTETTAGFLTGLFNHLLRPMNSHILKRVTAEIRDNFASDSI